MTNQVARAGYDLYAFFVEAGDQVVEDRICIDGRVENSDPVPKEHHANLFENFGAVGVQREQKRLLASGGVALGVRRQQDQHFSSHVPSIAQAPANFSISPRADPKTSRRLTCGLGPSAAFTLIALPPAGLFAFPRCRTPGAAPGSVRLLDRLLAAKWSQAARGTSSYVEWRDAWMPSGRNIPP